MASSITTGATNSAKAFGVATSTNLDQIIKNKN